MRVTESAATLVTAAARAWSSAADGATFPYELEPPKTAHPMSKKTPGVALATAARLDRTVALLICERGTPPAPSFEARGWH